MGEVSMTFPLNPLAEACLAGVFRGRFAHLKSVVFFCTLLNNKGYLVTLVRHFFVSLFVAVNRVRSFDFFVVNADKKIAHFRELFLISGAQKRTRCTL